MAIPLLAYPLLRSGLSKVAQIALFVLLAVWWMLVMVSGTRGKPRMTAWVKVNYHRPTPLGPLRIEAEVDRVDGFKTHAVGRVLCDGEVTADAEGLFVLPRWLREE